MAEYSDLDDLSLCQVLELSGLGQFANQPQTTDDLDRSSVVENPTVANLFDTGADVAHTYSSEIAPFGTECGGTAACDVGSMDTDDSKALISIAKTCCYGDILTGDAEIQDPHGISNFVISEINVEENTSPPVSNSGCSPPDTNEAAEPVLDDGSTVQLENAAIDSTASKEPKLDEGDGGGGNPSNEELMTEKCSKNFFEPQASDDTNPSAKRSSSLSAEESSSKSGDPSEEKKPPVLSFSSDVLLVAPTGKAANVLGRRTGIQAFTLHHVIFSYRAWRQSEIKSQVGWKFDSIRALVVDESSLVAVTTFYSLISKLLPSLQKVVLLGDILQLPSILPGRPCASNLNLKHFSK